MLERGWGRVEEGLGGLGKGLRRGWGRVREGLDFKTSKAPVEKPHQFGP